jgi:HD superfamily phosphodiesterase
MTIPDRREAARLLCSLEPPAWFVRHATVVGDVAAWLAARTVDRALKVDRALVESGALLHDVDKLPHAAVPGTRHGDGSARWLSEHGCPELGPVVRDHPVTRLTSSTFDAWLADAPLEALIVAYADKRGGQRLESMDARFASWRRRYPSGWDATTEAAVRERARRLEAAVCRAAGVRPAEVRRLRWSGKALTAAAA